HPQLRSFPTRRSSDLTYNLIRTAQQGSFLKDEAAEAAPYARGTRSTRGWHQVLESKPILFTVLALIAILIGGVIEMVPTFLVKSDRKSTRLNSSHVKI